MGRPGLGTPGAMDCQAWAYPRGRLFSIFSIREHSLEAGAAKR